MIEYSIVNKSAIHISMDKLGGRLLIKTLLELKSVSCVSIKFETIKHYRGKVLSAFKFIIVEEGEYVFFKDGILFFELENEMVEEFILFIENAINNCAFKTPEIISFSPKSKKDFEITICGFFSDST